MPKERIKLSLCGKPFQIRVVSDWEEYLHLFLKDAIQSPHKEPEICEQLISYVHQLVKAERELYRRKIAEVFSRHYSED